MAEKKKRLGRPTKPGTAGQRNSLGLRVTAETKRKLEAAALKSGRSQSQEAEFLIEQAFLEEEAYGRELLGLVKLMAGAADIIQARTEKSWSSDWETAIAVRAAWKTLAAAVGPRPPTELIQHFVDRADQLPPPPELPTRPSPPRRGLLTQELMGKLSHLIAHDSVEAKDFVAEVAAIEKENRKYDRRSAKYERELEALRQDFQACRDRLISYQDLGEDVATALLLRREAFTETGNPSQVSEL